MATNDERSAAMEMMKNALSKPKLMTPIGEIDLAKAKDKVVEKVAEDKTEQDKK